jgi:hypothetical protein
MIRVYSAVLILLMVFLSGAVARADSIMIDGKIFSNVKIHETSTRYYVRLPDGSAISVDKNKIQPGEIVFGDGPLPLQAVRDRQTREAAEKEAAEKAAADQARKEAEARTTAEKDAADQARKEAEARAAQEVSAQAATERAQREAAEQAAREAAEKAEVERAAREAAEKAAKAAQEQAAKEAAERQAAEEARREAEAKAQEELAARQAAEQAAKEAAEKAAQDRAAREAAEQAAKEAAEKAAKEAAEREAAEQAAKEATEKAIREAAERAVAEKAAKEAAEMAAEEAMKRAAAEQAAKEAAEKAAQEAADRAAAEKAAKEAAEKATREAQERAAAEKTAREALEQAAREAADRETAEQAAREAAQREVAEKAARDAAEQAAREAADREEAEKAARDAAEQAAREAADREAAEKTARDAAEQAAREAADREAAEKAARDEAEKAVLQATDREAAEKVARDAAEQAAKAAAERAAAEQAARERLEREAAEQAERERLEREEAEREAAEQAERERLEREEAMRRAMPVTTAYTSRIEPAETIAPDTPLPIRAGAASLPCVEGEEEPGLEINTLVLNGAELTVAFCTVDLASVGIDLEMLVIEALESAGSALSGDTLFLSATGVYTPATRGLLRDAWIEPRFGRYSGDTAAALAGRIAEALLAAEAALAPARLRWAEAEAPDCHTAREGGSATTDSTLGVLLAETPEGQPLAYLLNFAVSPPVVFGEAVSPDRGVPGETARFLRENAANHIPVLFTNAAAGDVELKTPVGAQNPNRDRAIGWVLAGAALAALETVEPRDAVQLSCKAHTAEFPPALNANMQPAHVRIREIHLDEAAFLALPGIPAAQIGMLLRVKGYDRGFEQLFPIAQCGEGAVFHPTIEEFFAVTPHTRLCAYGPLMISWFGAHYLEGRSEADDPVWANVPILNRYASTFRAALERGLKERAAIAEQWEKAVAGVGALAEWINANEPESEEIEALRALLGGDSSFARHVAAVHIRGQYADFTEEQRVILMGVAQGSGLPFDAILLLQIMARPESLPEEAAALLDTLNIEGYPFL